VPPWFAGVTYGFFNTRLVHDHDIALQEDQMSVILGRRLGIYTVHANIGTVLGGTLETQGRTFTVERGWLASVGVARRWILGADRSWFVTGSLTLGASSAPTREGEVQGENITATDMRMGVIGGVTLWDTLSPYLLVRAFGGPVFWAKDDKELVAGDAYHYNLGSGMSVELPGNVIALVDASVLGERSLSFGVSMLF